MGYDLRIVQEYIDGGELDGYDIDTLEDDPAFMKQAILLSGDKKLYSHCSDRAKTDLEFVEFLITRFYFDYEFIDEVATTYLQSIPEEQRAVIAIKMCNILKNSRNEELKDKYRLIFYARYIIHCVEIEKVRLEHPNDPRIGLGFFLFFDEYNFDTEVLNYFANEIIVKLLEDRVCLPKILHQEFKTPDDLIKKGINVYMIEFLARYDGLLSDYAMVHLEVLEGFRERIDVAIEGWDRYVDREEEYDYEEMHRRIEEYYITVEDQTDIPMEDLIHYIGVELGISDKIAKYYGLTSQEYEAFYGGHDDKVMTRLLTSLPDRIIYSNMKKIVRETIFGIKEEEEKDGKIIEVDFSKLSQ